jgi:Kdo2-lipid IVA lauroyltransferase/acyltransferase
LFLYYIIFPVFYLLSLLPSRILYWFSDAVYFLVYYCFGYRKNVVMQNLTIAFPNKTQQEKIRIAKKFYHLFVDIFIETIELISMSKKSFLKKIDFDPTLIYELQKNNQNIQLHSGHFFNYEFMNFAIAIHKQQFNWLGIYSPLGNKSFDKLMMNLRSKFGTTLIPNTSFKTQFHKYTSKPYLLGLAADQNTHNPHNAIWTNFFGKKTPFVIGPEKGAKAMNTAVVMVYIYPIKRGYYKMETTLLTQNPNDLPHGAITKALANFIETKINQHPSNYLWTHKRWKHEYDEEKFKNLLV